MNISDVNVSTKRSEHLKNSSVQSAQAIAPVQAASEDNQDVITDRVEISNDARTAARSSEDLSFARNALNSIPELSEARTAEITERIKSGYYSNPDVLQSIAERLGSGMVREAR